MVVTSLSADEIKAVRAIFWEVRACAAEVLHCTDEWEPPIRRTKTALNKYDNWKKAICITTASLLFPSWKTARAGEIAQFSKTLTIAVKELSSDFVCRQLTDYQKTARHLTIVLHKSGAHLDSENVAHLKFKTQLHDIARSIAIKYTKVKLG